MLLGDTGPRDQKRGKYYNNLKVCKKTSLVQRENTERGREAVQAARAWRDRGKRGRANRVEKNGPGLLRANRVIN